jgi:hypothetical protein
MTPPAASSAAPISPPAAQPVPHVLPTGVVFVSPVVHMHPMRFRGPASFRQPKLYVAATLSHSEVSSGRLHRSSLMGGYGGRVCRSHFQ